MDEDKTHQPTAAEPAQPDKEIDAKLNSDMSDDAAIRAEVHMLEAQSKAMLKEQETYEKEIEELKTKNFASKKLLEVLAATNPPSMHEGTAEAMRQPEFDSFWKIMFAMVTNKRRLDLCEEFPELRSRQLFGTNDNLFEEMVQLQKDLDSSFTGLLSASNNLPEENGFRQAVKDHVLARLREEAKYPILHPASH